MNAHSQGVKVFNTGHELRTHLGTSGRCVLVPTMGALHAGHADLVARGAALARQHQLGAGCVVSIFVNPSQFDDPADFGRYPKTLDADIALCERAGGGAACIYAPAVEDVYPPPPAEPVIAPPLPAVATEPRLEDTVRRGHFAGVCRVVKRLLEIVEPRLAVFGEKDWQQLQVVLAMTREARMGIDIIGAPTVREADGLAMSSRNRFLSAEDRRRGLAISRALRAVQGVRSAKEAEKHMDDILAAESITPDYAVVRDAATLLGPGDVGPWRALIAAKVGSVRLIDNAAWEPG